MNEIQRVLRPGGKALILVNNLFNLFLAPLLYVLLQHQLKRYTSYEPSFPCWRLKEWAEMAGLVVVESGGVNLLPKVVRYLDLFAELNGAPLIRSIRKLAVGPSIALARFLEKLPFLSSLGEQNYILVEKPS